MKCTLENSIIWYGSRSLLLTKLNLAARDHLDVALAASGLKGLEEIVLGFDSLLVIFQDAATAQSAYERIHSELRRNQKGTLREGDLHQIPVDYSGPDLESVAAASGLSVPAVIKLHSSPEYRVRMIGFTPGFPYLDGLDPRLHLPRRDSPRDHIRPGSVAIGGSHAGIYSVASPGGWHILGSTQYALFNTSAAKLKHTDAKKIFRLQAGDRVQFVPQTKKESVG